MPHLRRSLSALLALVMLLAPLVELGLACASHHESGDGSVDHSMMATSGESAGAAHLHPGGGDPVAGGSGQETAPPSLSAHESDGRGARFDPPSGCAVAGMLCGTTALAAPHDPSLARVAAVASVPMTAASWIRSPFGAPEPPPPRT